MSNEVIIYTKDFIMPDKAARLTETITHGGGVVLMAGGSAYTLSDIQSIVGIIAILFGMLISTLTLVMSWYYRRKVALATISIRYEQDRREVSRNCETD